MRSYCRTHTWSIILKYGRRSSRSIQDLKEISFRLCIHLKRRFRLNIVYFQHYLESCDVLKDFVKIVKLWWKTTNFQRETTGEWIRHKARKNVQNHYKSDVLSIFPYLFYISFRIICLGFFFLNCMLLGFSAFIVISCIKLGLCQIQILNDLTCD